MTTHLRRTAALFDLVAPEYDQHVPFFSAYAQRFVPWLGVAPHHDVLDIGTGRGALSRQAEEIGAHVVGIDVSMEMLARGAGARCLMDAQQLGFRSGCFDVAMGAFSIHLLPDPPTGVAEAVRVLRPGGIFGVAFSGRTSTPQWDFYHDVLRRYSVHACGEPRLPPVVPFGDPHEVLASVGLVDIDVTECEIHVRVVDSESFLRGELAHGYRSLFDVIPPEPRRQMEAELRERLDEMCAAGGIVLDRIAVFAKGSTRET